MRCGICENLQVEHSRECEIEASAILEQRLSIVRGSGGQDSTTGMRSEEIGLASRRRQAQIALSLRRHKAADHRAATAAAVAGLSA
jgi:hypothetical protein